MQGERWEARDQVGQILHNLAGRLYSRTPQQSLYHYTSLDGLMGIVGSGKLRASEARYLNDADELAYLAKSIGWEIARRLPVASVHTARILEQFATWTTERLTDGYMLFVASFTEHGNLLSQWRGYCPFGQGVSLGISPEKLAAITHHSGFRMGQCVYGSEDQSKIVSSIIDGVVEETERRGPSEAKHSSQCYYGVFEELEPVILSIGALFKNATFKEEGEWRMVSPPRSNFRDNDIQYRTGKSMLIPYLAIDLRLGQDETDFDHVYVGPTPTPNLSHRSLHR
ncbi:DUF2971 domain-containing protein [Caulobacter sp.]|uniref:DUF2971 domain-containing protein n=1 Tax=Caulobacter sp. TaxID=78 RepID=UPI0016161CCE